MRTCALHSLLAPMILGAPLIFAGPLRAGVVYLALGDSATFGNDPSTPSSTMPNYGDQGFVKPFADFLGTLHGGTRPEVVNLAISGELSSSFVTGVPPGDWPFRRWDWNLHYPNATTSQNDLMLESITAAHEAGDTIGYVTFLIGANDFSHLIGSSAYQAASPAEQQLLFIGLLQDILGVYATALTELKNTAPEARVFLLSYYNPFPSSYPAHDLYEQAISAFNPLVQQTAEAFGANYVDIHGPIAGHELEWTNILLGDIHLNQRGYAVVARELAAVASVPEPSTWTTLTIAGGPVLCGLLVRRRPQRRDENDHGPVQARTS